MSLSLYGEQSYWEERYKLRLDPFEWYSAFWCIAALLERFLPRDQRILQVGVGTSNVQEQMVQAGFQHIVNIDFSDLVVHNLSELHRDIPQLEYRVADVRSMPEFADASFGGILDKGCLDSVVCNYEADQHVHNMLRECSRVLQSGSSMLIVTCGEPASRLPYLDRPALSWAVQVYCLAKIEDSPTDQAGIAGRIVKGPYPSTDVHMMKSLSAVHDSHYYVYVCTKSGGQQPVTEHANGDHQHTTPEPSGMVSDHQPSVAQPTGGAGDATVNSESTGNSK